MHFDHPLMLIAVAATLVPIILHLLNRRSAKLLDWGAMQFLLGSLISRRRRMLLEEMMLLAMRCLLFTLAALVVARPLVLSDSSLSWISWAFVLPALLLGSVALGVGTAFWQERIWRWRLWAVGCLMLLSAMIWILLDQKLHLGKKIGSDRDVAIVIDASSSMNLKVDGVTNFQRAKDEARSFIAALGDSATLTVILAGATPEVVTESPLTHRDEMDKLIEGLKPLGGSAALRQAIHVAAMKLKNGPRSAKQIVVFSDQRKDGWSVDDPPAWQETAAELKSDRLAPNVHVRTLPLPHTVRNLSITQVELSRSVVGTDRPLSVNVTLKNTGTEPVSAAKVQLLCDGKVIDERPHDRLDAGQTALLSFPHRFEKPGAKVLEARIADTDDLADDNSRLFAVQVLDRLPVLIVNGNPTTDFLQQASAYAQLALEPDEGTGGGEEASYRPLVAVTVRDANNVADEKDFSDYRVIVLADVPQLSDAVAERIAEFVNQGGGLLVAPGSRALPEFYNRWRRADGSSNLLPALFGQRFAPDAGRDPAHLALSTFTHPALAALSDARRTDLGTAIFQSYWKLIPKTDGNIDSGARLTSGEPLLVEERSGSGTVALLSVSLDTASGNLATRKSFPVLMHSLVYHLAELGRGGLTHEAGKEAVLNLSAETAHPLAYRTWKPGLQADYFAGVDLTRPAAVRRVDETVNFDWSQAAPVEMVPSDKFAVRWTGAIVAPESDSYKLILTSLGKAQLWLDGKELINRSGPGSAAATVALKAGIHELKIEEIKIAASEGAKLEWQSAKHPRQIVPVTALMHSSDEQRSTSDDDAFVVTTPAGKELRLQGEIHDGALALKMPPAAALGVYYVRPPDSFAGLLASAEDERGRIPVALTSRPGGSELAALTKDDWRMLRTVGGLHLLDNAEDVRLLALNKAFGQELWTYLALAALAILVCEIALTRWIAIQRQATSAPVSEFEYHTRAHHSAHPHVAEKRAVGVSAAERFANPQKTFSL